MSRLIFIGGGARSGKSSAAVRRALAHDKPRAFIATAESRDEEMAERIRAHKADRGDDFVTIDAPSDLNHALNEARDANVVIIDCLTLWLSNLLLADQTNDAIDQATEAWIDAARQHRGTIIVVSNEVGQGIVPNHPLGRRYRDLAGRLNARVAEAADYVEIRFFGLGLTLKSDKH